MRSRAARRGGSHSARGSFCYPAVLMIKRSCRGASPCETSAAHGDGGEGLTPNALCRCHPAVTAATAAWREGGPSRHHEPGRQSPQMHQVWSEVMILWSQDS